MTSTSARPSVGPGLDPVHGDKGTTPGEGRRMLEKYLQATVRFDASDLIVKVDLPPRVRLRGSLKNLQTDECSEPLMFQIAKDVLDEKQYAYFQHHGSIDFAYDYDEDNRFRCPPRPLTRVVYSHD